MKLTVLVENTPCACAEGVHGLSLWLESGGKHILFDAGPDGAVLLRNAAALRLRLADADFAVLSHAHYDHAGGLETFAGENPDAPLYLRPAALFENHFAGEAGGLRKIGDLTALRTAFAGRLVLTPERLELDENLTLFSNVEMRRLVSGAAAAFTVRNPDGTDPAPDDFRHEQNLLIREGEKLILVCGCAHCGIANILDAAEQIAGKTPDAVIGGFHLTNPGKKIDEPESLVRAVGEELAARNTVYYTGHCTGAGPFAILKEILGDRLFALHAGFSAEV